jgi:DNA-binding SARP family transcriptional activator
MIPTLHMRLLGGFLLLSDGTPVTTINSPRLQSLLAYLVLHRATLHNRSHLAFLFWPDSTEERAHTSLRKLVHQLRQTFPDIDHFLYSDRQSLYWRPEPDACWTLDTLEFEQALAYAEQAEQRGDTDAQRQALEQGIALYRGDLLPSCYDEWILPERDRLHLLFLQAAARLIALLEQERDYETAIAMAQHLLRQDPLHEATYRQLMRLYALHGNRAAALRTYHSCVTVIERELGTEPSSITREIYESLLQSESTSETPAPRGTEAPLIGRKAEWRQLQEAWHKISHGGSHIVILSGEAGIGKTRLAEEMEAWVSRQGMAVASARCYTASGQIAYAPVTTWLRADALQTELSLLDPAWTTELARLVPGVLNRQQHIARPAAITEGWQRQQFFEALAHAVLSARQPLLLLLDDLQWCDKETLEWLHYLVRFDPGARLLLIGTVRTEETSPAHPLIAFLSTLQRDGLVTEIALGPLTTAETTSLAEHTAGHQLDSTTSTKLYQETEGNPLFVVEMMRAGTWEQPAKAPSITRRSFPLLTQPGSSLPPVVQGVLTTRLGQLSPLARELANVAAVIGREFTFSVLVRASQESEDDVVRGLDELWQRRIVREQGDGMATEAYDFSHDKLRELAYLSLSPASQRLLHRRVAEALEAIYIDNLDTVSGQIAVHYERAGLVKQAIAYCQRAGEVARRIYANAEAIAAFERAATLLDTAMCGGAKQEELRGTAIRVYEVIGDISVEIGHSDEAVRAYQHAMSFLPEQAYIQQARFRRKLAKSWNYVSNNPRDAFPVNARQALQEAERILTSAADPANAAWRDEWIELQFAHIWPLRGSADDMTAAIEKARPIIGQYGTPEQRKALAEAISMRDGVRKLFSFTAPQQALASRRAALTEALQTGNKVQIGTAHFALGATLTMADQLDEAEEQLGIALRIAEQLGIAWMQARSLTFLLFLHRRRGEVEQVRNVLAHADAVGAAQNNNVIAGHRAWLAWREGNLTEAETYGRASVEELQPEQMEHNPFQWTGLWPLIGVECVQEKLTAAMNHIRKLLNPTQQPPPEQLRTRLAAVLQAWDAGQQEEARTLLQQALPIAEEMGYL